MLKTIAGIGLLIVLIIYGVIEYLDGELTGKTIVKVKKKCPKTTGPSYEVVEGAGGRIEVEVTGRISSVMLDPEIEDYYKMSVGKKYLVDIRKENTLFGEKNHVRILEEVLIDLDE